MSAKVEVGKIYKLVQEQSKRSVERTRVLVISASIQHPSPVNRFRQ